MTRETHTTDLNRRLRQAFIAGAEAQSQRDHGRELTATSYGAS